MPDREQLIAQIEAVLSLKDEKMMYEHSYTDRCVLELDLKSLGLILFIFVNTLVK